MVIVARRTAPDLLSVHFTRSFLPLPLILQDRSLAFLSVTAGVAAGPFPAHFFPFAVVLEGPHPRFLERARGCRAAAGGGGRPPAGGGAAAAGRRRRARGDRNVIQEPAEVARRAVRSDPEAE